MKSSKMKKVLIPFLATTMAASMFAGCSNTTAKTTETSSPAATTVAKKKVVVWTNNRHDLDYMKNVVKEYNDVATNPVVIDYVVQADNYDNMIVMATSSGQAPDVMSPSGNITNLSKSGIIQPITSYITDDFKKKNDVDNLKFEGLNSLGKDIYWVPTGMRSGNRIIYNKDLFKKSGITQPPKTVAEVVADAKKITADGAGKTYGIIFPGQSSAFERWLESAAEMSGVKPYDYKNGRFDFSGFKPFVEAARQMFNDKSTFPGSETMKVDPARTQFAEGLVGIHANASQEVGVLTTQFPAKMEWGVAEIPTLDGKIKGALSTSPNNGWEMSAKTQDAKSAWKVIEYFGSEKVLKGYLEGGYTLPITSYMDKLIDKTKTGRMADFALKDYESVYPQMPAVTPEGSVYRDALWNACVGADIDKTLSDLTKAYNDALDKDVKMGKLKRLIIKDYDPMKPSKGTIEYLDK